MKKILSVIMASLMLSVAMVGCGSKPAAETPKPDAKPTEEQTPVTDTSSPATKYGTATEGKFVMGLDDSFPPMGFRDDNNEIVGLDIDIARAICDKLGLELVLQPINWDTKEMELETGNIDVIWNALTITPARQESMLISKPYLKNNQVICVKADSAIASKADLAGKKVAVQLGSSADEALMKDDISSKIGEKLEFDNNVSALLDCKTGGVDAVVLDEVVANYYAKQEPDSYKVLSDSLAAEEYGIAFKKGNQKLHDSIMNEFDALAKDGTLKGVSEKWFGKDIIVK
ncbi:MAG: amino acid ABC transporter substrate-binding protein [Oscillospiraceae bacterium]